MLSYANSSPARKETTEGEISSPTGPDKIRPFPTPDDYGLSTDAHDLTRLPLQGIAMCRIGQPDQLAGRRQINFRYSRGSPPRISCSAVMWSVAVASFARMRRGSDLDEGLFRVPFPGEMRGTSRKVPDRNR